MKKDKVQKSAAPVGALIQVCPGGRHAYYDCPLVPFGRVHKPYTAPAPEKKA
jgi:hypothetical protein